METGWLAFANEWPRTLEWSAVVFSLLYVVLATRQNVWCWLFGGLSSVISIVVFFSVQLYAESVLHLFYVIMAMYGWWQWNRPAKSDHAPIVEWGWQRHALSISISLTMAFLIYYVFSSYTDAKLPHLDALTTAFGFVTTYLVSQKVLSNWLYWIAIDVLSVYLYWSRDLNIYALLMLAYAIVALYGYYQWRKDYQKQIAV